MSTEAYADLLLHSQILQERPLRAAMRALRPAPGSRGLDAGCGIGLQAVPLARLVGPAGRVTGLDLCMEHLIYARRLVAGAGLSGRITLEQGDMCRLPFGDGAFDWAWSASAAYTPEMVKEMARVVRPGGRVAMVYWSSEMLLPGYPFLEARLAGTAAGNAPATPTGAPETHPLRALGFFREAGLVERSARTFCGDLHAPLTEAERLALTDLLAMRWPGVESELSPEDLAEYRRLCTPGSPGFIVDHPDYYAFFTYSLFLGSVPRGL